MIFSPLIWKRHKHRLNDNNCPHCDKPIRWVYDGEGWLPCDRDPVMFIPHPEGSKTVIYHKKEWSGVLLYRRTDERCRGKVFQGLIQHYYTCPILLKHRRAYIERFGRRE